MNSDSPPVQQFTSATDANLLGGLFERLMEKVRQGSQDAAWELVEGFSEHIRRIARRGLHPAIQSRFDSADFVQAVWQSFFTGEIRSFTTAEDLLHFLTRVTRNKLAHQYRRSLGLKRDVRRNLQFACEKHENLPASCSTPSQVLIAKERWFRLLSNQPAQTRKIIEMKFMGESIPAIAAACSISSRHVNRILARVLLNQKDD